MAQFLDHHTFFFDYNGFLYLQLMLQLWSLNDSANSPGKIDLNCFVGCNEARKKIVYRLDMLVSL